MPTSENVGLRGRAMRAIVETPTPNRDVENSIIWRHGQSVDAANSQKLEAETARSTAIPAAVRTSRVSPLLHHIVIVGGGAAGLELPPSWVTA